MARNLRHAVRLALVEAVFTEEGEDESTMNVQAGLVWEALQNQVQLSDVVAYSDWTSGVNVVLGDHVERLRQQQVSAGFFRVLAVSPAMGRGFSDEEDSPGGADVVMLSHPLWTRFFAADPAAIGRLIRLRGVPHRVIGVMLGSGSRGWQLGWSSS